LCPWTACEFCRRQVLGILVSAAGPGRERRVGARFFGAAFFIVLALAPVLAQAQNEWSPLVRRLEADGFDRSRMEALFARSEVRFDPKVMARKMNALLDTKLSQGQPKAEAPEIFVGYLNPLLLMQAKSFLADHQGALREARLRYHVPEDILVALLLVETKLGRNVGTKGALTTLASMALAGDFALVAPLIERRDIPPKLALWLRWRTAQKSAWAYKELKALLIYAKAAGFDPASIPGSVYGAIGICQFMPTNAVRYGADLDGDGRVDLFSVSDAVLSAARFLNANGWTADLPRERQSAVLYRFNHSHTYTRTIMVVADILRGSSSGSSPGED
jgi:membrane-bound lytic murein transglycosylase B